MTEKIIDSKAGKEKLGLREELGLTFAEREVIEKIKKSAGRDAWVHGCVDSPDAEYGKTKIRDRMSLSTTCQVLEVNFVELAKELSARFPNQTIKVLYEGCGFSTFPEEFEERCRKEGISVEVTRTDIYSKEQFAKLAAEESKTPELVKKGIEIKPDNYVQATPEELFEKFGDEKFHLVISRSGGMTYTPLPKVKGLYSISRVLCSKGEAHLLTENVTFDYHGSWITGTAIKLKDAGELTPEGEFFKNSPRLTVEESPYEYILRIRKDLEPSQEWKDKLEYETRKPVLRRRATNAELEQHKTIFDLMEKPPVEMSEEQFLYLRGLSRTMETQDWRIGRDEGSGPILGRGSDLFLECRYGRYYITSHGEFGIRKVLWREEKPPWVALAQPLK